MPKNFDENSLVYISTYFNKQMVSLAPVRNRQDSKFVKKIRKLAIEKMGGLKNMEKPELFFVGSVDFMVTESDDKKEFVILEANGGSSRGIMSLAPGQTEMIFNAYKEAIDNSAGEDDNRLVVIGTIPSDQLFQEKIMLCEFLKERYEIEGYSVGVYNSFNYDPKKIKDDIVLVITNYENLLDNLSYKNEYVTFKGQEVNVIIGDGVARRFPIISAYIKYDINRVKTKIVNPVYQITDDKGNTYLAIQMFHDRLKKYRIKTLDFGKASDPFHLESILDKIIKNFKKNYILKPFGGSGGVGIQPISPKFSEDRVTDIMEKSISEFYEKFDARRTPYPYTIQEMANFSLIDFNNSKRTFDIRIYIAQINGQLVPLGGEARVAKLPYTGTLKKEEFVVNLSGFGGIEIERAVPFSKDGLQMLNLSEEDLVDMFCASCELFSIITEHYTELVQFSDWNKFFGED